MMMIMMVIMLDEISHIPSLDYSLASQSKRPVHFIRLLLNFLCVYTYLSDRVINSFAAKNTAQMLSSIPPGPQFLFQGQQS